MQRADSFGDLVLRHQQSNLKSSLFPQFRAHIADGRITSIRESAQSRMQSSGQAAELRGEDTPTDGSFEGRRNDGGVWLFIGREQS